MLINKLLGFEQYTGREITKESHSAFIGEIPRNYEKYLGPLIFSDYAEDLANRIIVARGGSVLEIAAGTGIATRYFVARFPRICAL